MALMSFTAVSLVVAAKPSLRVFFATDFSDTAYQQRAVHP